MKTILFVPGFRENISSRDYSRVISVVNKKGYKTVFIPINWNRTSTIEDWVNELKKEYRKYKSSKVILAGFSFGAVTAFITATQNNPSELWLFSLSAVFAEDLPKLKKSRAKEIGKRRIKEFSNYSFIELVKKISCKTLIFVGEKEAKKYPQLNIRASEANKLIKNSKLIFIQNCDHDIADAKYLKAVESSI